ncbi:Light-sensor Protein kinase [Ceratobasidium sp. 395]|nr:Light-sensor Protein kinase [Ceratobasidium sp. 395]
MAVVMHDSVDGAVIRSSVHGRSKMGKAGTSNAGTDACVQPSGAGSVQSHRSVQRSGTGQLGPNFIQPGIICVVVGREGQLARCEDEPIRVPGAVHGFDVLIALEEEDYETGNLVVRQVSENTSEILGLTPQFLFSLAYFTQTSPDSQADILRDNVHYLHDPALESQDTADNSPHIFLLSGWGEPGSGECFSQGVGAAIGGLGEVGGGDRRGMGKGQEQRREWTCWCAAHRLKQPIKGRNVPSSSAEASSAGGYLDPNQFDDAEARSPLVILKFELERDVLNPLYPPCAAMLPIDSSGVLSGGGRRHLGMELGVRTAVESAVRGRVGRIDQVTEQQGTPKNRDHGGGNKNDEEEGLLSKAKEVPTGIGRGTIQGPSVGEGKTADEGLAEAETVVPVGVGRAEGGDETGVDEKAKGQSQGGQPSRATPTTHEPVAQRTDGHERRFDRIGPERNRDGSELGDDLDCEHGADGEELSPTELRGLIGEEDWHPSLSDVLESTISRSRPLRALERMRCLTRGAPRPRRRGCGSSGGDRGGGRSGGGVGTMDAFALLTQINDQLSSAPDLDSLLNVVVGVIKDLMQFHRVLVYQFDDQWNGQCVAELVDWSQTHDIFKGLHLPAGDIPAQARELYTINKVRLLYDRSQTTARLVVRDRTDLKNPLDMTHAYLRAMSPIHIKYLANMGVRASMSISIITFGQLWGLVACHSYGPRGMRVSFPVRQMLRLLSDSISRNIERLSYVQRLRTRKLISTLPTEEHPTGYIVSDAEDLISLFDADFGVLVIGEGAKILGRNEHEQETLIVAEYLRRKQFNLMQVSQAIATDLPDLKLPAGLDAIAGLLYVPLSAGGKDFIALMRKGHLRDVHWAGKPFKPRADGSAVLEPRKPFKAWKETVSGRCRAWTDEQLETAGVLALVYGKFIQVWRQKETTLKTNQLTNLLLSNASHEGYSPSCGSNWADWLSSYLEMALNGPLDPETRENLTRSHAASKNLLFTINDLLDLTRYETGNETFYNEPFDLPGAIENAVTLYRIEATRRRIQFVVAPPIAPR